MKIIGAILALAFGLWLGRAGRYDRPQSEVDRALGRGGPRKYTKRVFTPLDLLKNKKRRSERGGFNLKDPGAPPDDDDRPRVSLRGSRRLR